MKKEFLLSCLLLIVFFSAQAQSDTTFWFAVPDVSSAFNYDRPIFIRLTSQQQPCNVTISQPANGGLVTQNFFIPAYSTQSVDLTPWIDNLECAPGDVIQNRGIKITSTNKITAYYEVNANGPNPEIFSLKGSNAMGTRFFISSQYLLDNTATHSPTPRSSFNIVAAEDNTQVTITPTNNIVGHAANIAFTITLNKGQTYAAIATGTAASQHLQGSLVTATKPIAITIADDLLKGSQYGGVCEDLAGDQTVPVNIVGSDYIVFKSDLNNPFDKIYVTATQNGTNVTQDGIVVATLNSGQSAQLSISNNTSYIQLSAPGYVYQLAGVGCEVGGAVLPKLNCTGSSSVSVVRSSIENFIITLLVKNGGQGNFLLNSTAGIITAASFTVVPGTGGQWYAAKVSLPLSSYPNGSIIRISNTTHVFQMGFIEGGSNSGAGFGYFSDFNTFKADALSPVPNLCVGNTIQLSADTILSASYSWTGPNGFSSNLQNFTINNAATVNSGNYILTVTVAGCGSYTDTLAIKVNPKVFLTVNQIICQGQTYLGYNSTGTFIDTFVSSAGCDSIRTLNLTVKQKSFLTVNQAICQGQNYFGYSLPGTYIDTFIAANGCDSIRTLNLTVKAVSQVTLNQVICEGQTYLGHNSTGIYKDTLVAANGCDSIRTLQLTVKPRSIVTINQIICQGQTYLGYNSTGIYKDTLIAANGCDSIRTLNLTVTQKILVTVNQVICQGQVYFGHSIPGTFIDTFVASSGCDSIRTLNLTVKQRSFVTINQTICQGQTYSGYGLSGTYIDTFSAVNGCDSIRTLNLTVKPKAQLVINQVICDGQVYLGYNTTGVYNDTFVAANGCDSIRILNLTVKARSFVTINQAICQGQTYLGYSISGTYKDTFVAANGCDSIRTLVLIVKQRSFVTVNESICQGQAYFGHSLAGTYIDTFVASNGCDSIRTLHLTVKPISRITLNQIICEGQTYLGYGISGTYIDTFVAVNGCDSIRTLQLTVNLKSFVTINQKICQGQSYLGYTLSGTYNDTLAAVNGCDSIRTLHLEVQNTADPQLGNNLRVCQGDTLRLSPGTFDSYLWQDGSTLNHLVVRNPGTYTVTVTNSCGSAAAATVVSGGDCNIYFPNAFSPDHNTINDIFRILNAYNLQSYYLAIYNRWGEKVFETTDYTVGWDGNYKGRPANAGAYVWYCQFKYLKGIKKLKGTVVLIR